MADAIPEANVPFDARECAVEAVVAGPKRRAFDPERVLAAFLRGRRLRVDVMGRWDYWALMPLSLAEARAQLGIGDAAAGEAPVAER